MKVLNCFLQIVGEDFINNSISLMDSTSVNGNSWVSVKPYMISLAILLIVNVFIMVVNFVFDTIKHRKDNHNHKVHLIAQEGVKVESFIYEQFTRMASLQSGDEHQLLDNIIELDSFCNKNRLYIEKEFWIKTIDFLDYFKKIQYKMTCKDIEKEESYFETLSKVFYGE